MKKKRKGRNTPLCPEIFVKLGIDDYMISVAVGRQGMAAKKIGTGQGKEKESIVIILRTIDR